MTQFVYKTYDPNRSSNLFGEQVFLHHLLKDKVTFIYNGQFYDDGAVISIRANDNQQFIDTLNTDIAALKWCVIIVTGNENGSDFHTKIKHPNCKIWVQTPKMTDKADYFLPLGYPTIERHYTGAVRVHDWSFAGQVTHSRRYELVKVLEGLQRGKLVKTEGFGQGLAYPEYFRLLTESKVVPCPGGPATPDTFRFYEALEAGCVPIVDIQSGQGDYGGVYWEKVFGIYRNIPFPLIENWNDFPNLLELVLSEFTEIQAVTHDWWMDYKRKVVRDLFEQIESIR